MTALVILGGMIGAAGLVAAIRQSLRASRKEGPIQLGVGTKIKRS